MVDGGRQKAEDPSRPETKEKKARDTLLDDKYNVEASDSLANEALHLSITEAVPIYEQLLSNFPTAYIQLHGPELLQAKYWKQYVEAYMAVNNDDATKQIFSRCLLNCLQISLWRCYIRFIRKVNEKKGAEGQDETRKAFDFMLNYVGTDIASGPVWMEYIVFLKSMSVMTAQEESQRMTLVRKAYQKAIVTPTHHLEQLWKEYENFENSVSRALAKGLLSEYQPKYNSAKVVYRERKKFVDEIDWNMLAVPPTGSYKEEQQYMAWKRFLTFEKGNPQRIDSASSNRRIAFTYEQCLMYLYHYPDIWYDYATWQAKSGSIDSAIKVFQRALKALPDSEVLWYAYAELEECRGEIQSAKKIYETFLGNAVSVTALAHIQFIRFLRRTEGIEAARKYFLDTRKSPNCTYHVYVAYAMMAFCLDKDPKVAHNVFEAGLKRFMHEPGYILEYADFLCRLNDDRNIRALFERALSTLPPEESVEVWKRFTQFEQTYGDLASMLKVEQRKKEALSRTGEEGSSALEASLHDVVSRYSFMDLWPCSSADLDHLARQEWLLKNIDKKADKSTFPNGASSIGAEKGSSGLMTNSKTSMPSKVVYPDTSRMVIYDPRQKQAAVVVGTGGLVGNTTAAVVSSTVVTGPPPLPPHNNNAASPSVTSKRPLDEIMKLLPPSLVEFITHLPLVEGPSPNIDIVLSVLLQSNEVSGSNKTPLLPNLAANHSGKRKKFDSRGHEDDETVVQSSNNSRGALPRDAFMMRQIRKATKTRPSQTGSTASGGTTGNTGSMISGELSGSTS